jgi:hypothetical protein
VSLVTILAGCEINNFVGQPIEFGKVVEIYKWKETDPEKIKSVRPGLTTFISQHPDFFPAYMMRAMGDFSNIFAFSAASIRPTIHLTLTSLIAVCSKNSTEVRCLDDPLLSYGKFRPRDAVTSNHRRPITVPASLSSHPF